MRQQQQQQQQQHRMCSPVAGNAPSNRQCINTRRMPAYCCLMLTASSGHTLSDSECCSGIKYGCPWQAQQQSRECCLATLASCFSISKH
jgi:hypothetical protein